LTQRGKVGFVFKLLDEIGDVALGGVEEGNSGAEPKGFAELLWGFTEGRKEPA